MPPAENLPTKLGAAGFAWAAAVAAGFFLIEAYTATPGEPGDPPGRWPAASRLARDPTRANLVLLAHPRCPCTAATLAELEQIMTRCRGAVTAHVLFLEPRGPSDPSWRTGLQRTAEAIPDVRVLADRGGAEAARFGARTSGHALLYDPGGRLIFSGGLTGSRGHRGDNPGRAAVTSLLTGGQADRARTAVFGCPLRDPRRRCDEEAAACADRP